LKDFYNLRLNLDVDVIPAFDVQSFLHKNTPFLDKFQPVWNLMNMILFTIGLAFYFKKVSSDKNNYIYIRDVNICSWLRFLLPRELKDKIILELHYLPEKINRKKRYAEILKSCHRIIAITHKMKIDLVSLGLDERLIHVEHDGVDLQSFSISKSKNEVREELGFPVERFIIGYVGNFHTNGREKGIDDLIRASRAVLDSNPSVYFYFIGGPMDRVERYVLIIKEMSLPRERFVFMDRVPTSVVPKVMKACDILTIPLPWNEHFAFYMSPMKLFEYMNAGVPIFATNVESLQEVIAHNESAYMVQHSNQYEMEKGLVELANDAKLRNRLANNAISEVQEYSWDKRAKRIINFINSNGLNLNVGNNL